MIRTFFVTLAALITLALPAAAQSEAELKRFIAQEWGHVTPFTTTFTQIYADGGRAGGKIDIASPGRVKLHFNFGDKYEIEAGAVKIQSAGSRTWETYPLRHMAPLFRRAVNLNTPGVLGVGYDQYMPGTFPEGTLAVHMRDPSGEYSVQSMVYFSRDGQLLGWREWGGEGGEVITVIHRPAGNS